MLDRNSPFDTSVRFEAEKLADFAKARLRDAFVRCEIDPGAVITEAGMARRLGLGKAPVRTALASLAAEGWVQPAARRGHLVSPITLGSVQDIFEMRRALEPLLAQAAPAASKATEIGRQQNMAAALSQTEAKVAETSAMQAAREIRALLLEATGNRLLQASLPHLWDLSDRLDHYLERTGRTAPNAAYWAKFSTFVFGQDRAEMAAAIDDALTALQDAVEREFLRLGRDLPLIAPDGKRAAMAPRPKPAGTRLPVEGTRRLEATSTDPRKTDRR